MKKGKKKILALGAACLLLAVALVLMAKSGGLFQVQDSLNRLFSTVEFETVELETQAYALEALKQDGRITFDQSGMLVGLSNMLPETFEADIGEYKDTGVLMNKAMLEAYAQLSQQVSQQFGQKLYVRSSYRTAQEQAQVVLEEGEKAIAVGASEHQTGLALDVYVKSYGGKAFLKSPVGRWVNSQCWQYGFIIRYPYYQRNEDGIGYEPWHIRYVGLPHAEIMYKHSWTLEDYFRQLSQGQWYQCGNYYISRQTGPEIQLPREFTAVTVSSDNAGGYLVTVTT